MTLGSEFKRAMRSLASDKILIPALHAALYSPDFAGFTVPVDPWGERTYDGRFHPSTHASWTVRQLWVYLVAHDLLVPDPFPLTGVLAVTAGSFWHKFVQTIFIDTVLLRQRPDGGRVHPAEVKIDDPDHNRAGHADGKLFNGEGLEIKTINGYQVEKIISEEVLREKKPDYWAQTQDYLDVLGLNQMRYLMINPDYPYRMSEFPVRANPYHQQQRRGDYKQAVELAQRYPDVRELENPQTEIPACCAPRSAQAKQCPARNVCPIGRMT